MSRNTINTRMSVMLTLAVVVLLSAGAVYADAQKPKLVMISAVTTADANPSSNEVNAVTSDDCFMRVHVYQDTTISQGGAVVALAQVKRGYKITCKGNWDANDRNAFNAAYVFIGEMVSDSDVMDRVAAACKKIARKGSFGSSSPSLNRLKIDFFMAVTKDDLPEVKRLLKKDPPFLMQVMMTERIGFRYIKLPSMGMPMLLSS